MQGPDRDLGADTTVVVQEGTRVLAAQESLAEVTETRWPALVWLVQESGPGLILGFPRSLPESEDESCFMNSTQLER